MALKKLTGRVTDVALDNVTGGLIFCLTPDGRDESGTCFSDGPNKAATYWSMFCRLNMRAPHPRYDVWIEQAIWDEGETFFTHVEPVDNANGMLLLIYFSLRYNGKNDGGWHIYTVKSNLGNS